MGLVLISWICFRPKFWIAPSCYLPVMKIKTSATPMKKYCGMRKSSDRVEAMTVWLLISWMKKSPRSMNVSRAVSTVAADRTDRVAKVIPMTARKMLICWWSVRQPFFLGQRMSFVNGTSFYISEHVSTFCGSTFMRIHCLGNVSR